MADLISTTETEKLMDLEERHGARNYAPLPVVLTRGEGVFVWDVEGTKYFDMLSAYSALNQGHNHPRIVEAAKKQLDRLCLTSRAFYNDRLGPFLQRLSELTGFERALPMNSGAEGVETAIKLMRRWGYLEKKIPRNEAEIIVCEENFHGRTTTIVGFSTDPDSYENFGPATPGFKIIPYNDPLALERAITSNTCGFLVEPVQGEAGVKIPSPGYLKEVRRICSDRNVLFCADEIQTGLGRTGKLFCYEYDGVRPDIVILGKALSGGLYPVSAVACDERLMRVFEPGTHGSTYGGNPLACAIGLAALEVIVEEELAERSRELGEVFLAGLRGLESPLVNEARGRGLLLALEFNAPVAKEYCKNLKQRGVLAKDTHGVSVRFAPPLVITRGQVGEALERIREALTEMN